MKFFAVATLLLAGVLATPVSIDEEWANTKPQPDHVCPSGLFSNPQCCATDVLGIIGIDCGVPPKSFNNANTFSKVCGTIGQQARCCIIPVAGQALLCQRVVGSG